MFSFYFLRGILEIQYLIEEFREMCNGEFWVVYSLSFREVIGYLCIDIFSLNQVYFLEGWTLSFSYFFFEVLLGDRFSKRKLLLEVWCRCLLEIFYFFLIFINWKDDVARFV